MLIVFSLIPVFYLLMVSFYQVEWIGGEAVWTYVGIANFREITNAAFFQASMRNTATLAIVAVIAEMILGFSLALLVSGMKRGRVVFITIILIPLLVPPIVIGGMWRLLYNFDFGLINAIVGFFGGSPVNWLGDPDLALASVIVLDIWHWTPFVFLLLLAGLEGLPEDVFEAARIDGASRWQQVRYITIPLMIPILAVTFLTRFLMALKMFDQVFLMTGGGPGTATEVLGLSVYRTFFLEDRQGAGSALAIIVILSVFVVGLLGRIITKQRLSKVQGPT